MTFREVGVGNPHHCIQLPEFGKEAGHSITDLFGVRRELGVLVRFDNPDDNVAAMI
jgi:hypothetical protein